MALADRATQQPPSVHGTPCSMGTLIARLEGEELAALETMLGTPERRGWSAADIYVALTEEGYTVGLQTINRHRGRKCRCFAGGNR